MSRILKEIHENATALYKLGSISKEEMHEFDILCIPPAPQYSPEDIKLLRKKYRLTQSNFAVLLNTNKSTVQKWEIGVRKPSGEACRLLQIIQKKGAEIFS